MQSFTEAFLLIKELNCCWERGFNLGSELNRNSDEETFTGISTFS